jgi:alanyl-tRNA synthetase
VLHATPDEVPEAIERLVSERRRLEDELKKLQQADLATLAQDLASSVDGAVAVRRDGLDPSVMRELALAVRDRAGVPVGIVGSPDGEKVAIVVAAVAGGAVDARAVAGEIAKLVGGGGGGSPELATAGGRDVAAIDLAAARLGELLTGG